jgi:hypothetical protein
VYDGLQRLLPADHLRVCLPFDPSTAIMALITSRTELGLVTFVALGPLAPMIYVAHWNSATPGQVGAGYGSRGVLEEQELDVAALVEEAGPR